MLSDESAVGGLSGLCTVEQNVETVVCRVNVELTVEICQDLSYDIYVGSMSTVGHCRDYVELCQELSSQGSSHPLTRQCQSHYGVYSCTAVPLPRSTCDVELEAGADLGPAGTTSSHSTG